MKKILIAILVLMLSHTALFAQGTTKQTRSMTKAEEIAYEAKFAKARAKNDSLANITLSKEIKKAQYIFEGTIIEVKQTGHDFVNQIIKIHKVFKGNLTCGTVKIISGDRDIIVDNSTGTGGDRYGELETGTSAIFLCSPYTSTPIQIVVTTIKPDNLVPLQINTLIQYDPFERPRYGSFKALYDRFLQEQGVLMEKCDSMDFQKQWDSAHADEIEWHKRHPYYQKDTAKAMPQQNNIKSKGPNNQEDDIAYPSSYSHAHGPNIGDDDFFLPSPPPPPPFSPVLNKVTYSIDSLTFDSLSQSVDFAIDLVYDNPDTAWLYSTNVFLNINSDAGALIKVNWNTDLFDPAHYVFEIDTNSTGFDLYVSDTTYIGMDDVPTSVTELCHVHLSLTACGVWPEISFDQAEMEMDNDLNYWFDTDSPYYHYYADTFIQPTVSIPGGYIANRITCNPVITSFTPSVIAAGVNDEMKIYGYNFGNRIHIEA